MGGMAGIIPTPTLMRMEKHVALDAISLLFYLYE